MGAVFGSGKTRITSLLTNLRLASVEFKEKDMRLLVVYSYRNQDIYKFIYKSIHNGYFWYYGNEVSKSQTSVIAATYNRIVRKVI